jgi:HlyD family secretion protein
MPTLKRLRPFLLLLVVVAALFAAWKFVFRDKPIPVKVQKVERGSVEEVVTNSRAGSVRARYRSQIGAETQGRVSLLPHREGASVDSNAVLFRLDDDVSRAQLSLARSDLQAARANLLAARAAAELAASELERTRDLAKRGVATEERLDTVLSQDKSARAQVDAAEAQVERAQAALQVAEAEQRLHVVRAPFKGVVNQLYVDVGASVIPGQAVLEFMSLRDLYISAPMDELDIGKIRVGQHARVVLDPYPNHDFPATVSRVAPYVSEFQEQNRTMEIELQLEPFSESLALRPGTSADVEIVIERHDDTLRIPAVALLEGQKVLVASDGRAQERSVRTGLRNWDFVEIVDGLGENDEVITSLESSALRAGVAITVQRDGEG